MKLLLPIIYLFIEIFFIIEFADEFGILTLFVEIIISAVIGFGVLLSQYSMLPGAYREILNGGIGNFIGRNVLRLIGAILLILPGILCDVVGVCFIIISLFFVTKEANIGQKSGYKRDDESEIIDVEIIEDKK